MSVLKNTPKSIQFLILFPKSFLIGISNINIQKCSPKVCDFIVFPKNLVNMIGFMITIYFCAFQRNENYWNP